MSIVQDSDEARLPQDLVNLTLAHVDDAPYLWTVCRQVNKAFRDETEFIFRNSWLQETIITWFKGHTLDMEPFRCGFSRVEGVTAYFKIQSFDLLHWREPLTGTNPDIIEYLVHVHQQHQGSLAYLIQNKALTSLGVDPNKTYFTDLALPELETHRDTNEISLNWKALFDGVFREELLLSTFKAKAGLDTPNIPYVDLTRPIVLPPRTTSFYDVPSDWDQRLQVRQRRIELLDTQNPYSEDRKSIAERSLLMFWQFRHLICFCELQDNYKLEFGECRGNTVYFVENPRANGWTLLTRKQRRSGYVLWCNNAWEDPVDEGRTTWSEDVLVVETEMMARAWEKGMA